MHCIVGLLAESNVHAADVTFLAETLRALYRALNSVTQINFQTASTVWFTANRMWFWVYKEAKKTALQLRGQDGSTFFS